MSLYIRVDPSISVTFSDERCDGAGVCPGDTVLVTCEAFQLTSEVLSIIIPPDESESPSLLYIGEYDHLSNNRNVTVVSKSVEEKNETLNYEISISLMGSVLGGGPIVCSDKHIESQSSCKVRGEPLPLECFP